MLDTIAINLQRNEFIIHEPDRFTPSAKVLNNIACQGRGVMSAHNNPTKEEKENGYLPRLTLFKKSYGDFAASIWLKIEFSAPKLIFGNNFEELRGAEDFDRVIAVLQNALKCMGIETTCEALINAKVTAIHYSKNIVLNDGVRCHSLIQALEKSDMNGRLDLSQSDFRNGGQMAKYHAGTYEIVLYDKVKDMEHARKFGDKRGAEKDYYCQTHTYKNPIKPEVLRFEVRLKSKKLKHLLDTLGIQHAITLKDMFCASLSRTVLLYYWGIITQGLYIVNIDAQPCEKLLYNIRTQFPAKRPSSALALMGFVQICQQVGMRGAKLILQLNDSQFYRLKADAKKLEQNHKCLRFQALAIIRARLDNFAPLERKDMDFIWD